MIGVKSFIVGQNRVKNCSLKVPAEPEKSCFRLPFMLEAERLINDSFSLCNRV